jgi:Tfp pilus assembly protein PilN
MRIKLNLATAPPQQTRPFLAVAALGGAIGLLALLLLAHDVYSSWESNRELRGDISRLQGQIRSDREKQQELQRYFVGTGARQVLDRSSFLNSLIDARSFPWTKIFMDLEKTLPPGVRVVSISPTLENGRAEVTLQVGAETDQSKIEFLKAMENSSTFSGMVVKDEQRHDETSAADKIVLSLTAWYSTT